MLRLNTLLVVSLVTMALLASCAWATVATVLVADGDHDTFLSKAHAVYVTSCGGSGAITNTANVRIFVGDIESGGIYTNNKGFLRFDIKDSHGTVTSATLHMYLHGGGIQREDVRILRPRSYWWPDATGDWSGAVDTLYVGSYLGEGEPAGLGWKEFDLDSTYVPMGRYFDIRIEGISQQACDDPPGAGDDRRTTWRSKDWNGVGDDEFTPYVVIDYDSTTVTCASVYVPNGASDGYLSDEVGTVCDGADANVFDAVTTIIAGENDTPDEAACYGYIRYSLSAIPDSIQSAWMTFTVDVLGAQDFGKVTLWKLDADFGTLGPEDWGASGTEIAEVLYDSLTVGETVTFDVTGYVTGGAIEPFQIQNEALCDGPGPLGDERIWLRASEYDGPSVPVMTICYFPTLVTRRYGPIVSHEPTANPMVKVTPR